MSYLTCCTLTRHCQGQAHGLTEVNGSGVLYAASHDGVRLAEHGGEHAGGEGRVVDAHEAVVGVAAVVVSDGHITEDHRGDFCVQAGHLQGCVRGGIHLACETIVFGGHLHRLTQVPKSPFRIKVYISRNLSFSLSRVCMCVVCALVCMGRMYINP